MNVCLYFHGFMLCSCLPLLFIILIVISHWFICDCVYSFFKFYFIVNLVNIMIHIDYVCAFAALFLLSRLFLFAVLFYLYTVLGYVWVCNFPCLHLTFLVLLHAFWWWMLFNSFALCLFHLLLPLPPFFVAFFFFFVGILFYFLLWFGFTIGSRSGYWSGFTNAACAPSLASNSKTTCKTKKSSREPACPA